VRIGELGTAASTTAKTIRFYEHAGLLPAPPRTPSGYGDYPPEAVRRLAFIRTAQGCGLTLADIRGILAIRDSGQPPCAHVTTLISGHLEQIDSRLAELQQAREALRQLARRAAKTAPATCTGDDICRILTGPPP
jgi:MerR family copper efflux transcriptional regulator